MFKVNVILKKSKEGKPFISKNNDLLIYMKNTIVRLCHW